MSINTESKEQIEPFEFRVDDVVDHPSGFSGVIIGIHDNGDVSIYYGPCEEDDTTIDPKDLKLLHRPFKVGDPVVPRGLRGEVFTINIEDPQQLDPMFALDFQHENPLWRDHSEYKP